MCWAFSFHLSLNNRSKENRKLIFYLLPSSTTDILKFRQGSSRWISPGNAISSLQGWNKEKIHDHRNLRQPHLIEKVRWVFKHKEVHLNNRFCQNPSWWESWASIFMWKQQRKDHSRQDNTVIAIFRSPHEQTVWRYYINSRCELFQLLAECEWYKEKGRYRWLNNKRISSMLLYWIRWSYLSFAFKIGRSNQATPCSRRSHSGSKIISWRNGGWTTRRKISWWSSHWWIKQKFESRQRWKWRGHDSESDYDDNSDDVEIDVIDSLSAIIKTQSIMIAPHFFRFIS